MLLEFISHALALDLVWIVGLIMNNLHWLFALLAYVVISANGKRPVWKFLALTGLLYAAVDIAGLANWVFVPLIIFIPINFMLSIFLENTLWEKHSLKLVVVLFFFLSFIHTFYFTFPGV